MSHYSDIKANGNFSIGDEKIDPELAEYQEELEDITQQALDGELDRNEFRVEMEDVVTAAIMLAFLRGGGNINSPEAQAALDQQRQIAFNSINTLTNDIYNGRYSEVEETETTPGQSAESGLQKLLTRVRLWVVSLAGVYAIGKLFTKKQVNYVWRLGNTIEHCSDCARLDGQVHTADEWRRSGIRPQSPDLECGGWNCDCRLEETKRESIGFSF